MYTVTVGNKTIAEHLTIVEASIIAEQIRNDIGDYEIHIKREEE